MKVFVTGGAGFLGSHVTSLLIAEGHQITVLDDLSTGSARNLPLDVEFCRIDVRAPLDDLLRQNRPEVVIHLAAQVSVPESVLDPRRDLSINIEGTANVMEASSRAMVRKVIAISSAAVYGIPRFLPVTEDSLMEALSPYGLSKLAGEQYVRLLGNLRGIAYTIIRPSNIFGPRQKTEGDGAVVPAFLNRFRSGCDPVIHGDGSQTRDFIYVTDVAQAIVHALDHGDGLTLNVSSGVRTSVNTLWQLLAGLAGWSRPPVYGAARPGDISDSVLANGAARKHLDWEPRVTLESGLEETVRWALK